MDTNFEKLKELKELLDSGIITQEEFEAQKIKILKEGEPIPAQTTPTQSMQMNPQTSWNPPPPQEKKSVLKKWWFWVIIIVLLILVFAAAQGNRDPSQTSRGATTTSTGDDSGSPTGNESTTAQKKQGTEKLTLAKYNQIQNGMTEKEVFEIIGFVGTAEAEVGEKGSEYYTISYRYMGNSQVKGSLGANASFMFQGGALTMKAQTGLSD